MHLLSTPAEGLHFTTQLLKQHIKCEAIGAYLYDINAHKFRLVSAEGEQSEQHTGEAVSSNGGLLHAASELIEEAFNVPDAKSDPRFDPAIDGHLLADPKNMLLIALHHEGRLLGILQLCNRIGEEAFNEEDFHIVDYVGNQLADFVHQARLRIMAS
ncbi:MAG: GAF domain-containing protein [Myxococcales bacterium]|nr:MAG: GAF domain-containing protein [Myxococcales bacterium]